MPGVQHFKLLVHGLLHKAEWEGRRFGWARVRPSQACDTSPAHPRPPLHGWQSAAMPSLLCYLLKTAVCRQTRVHRRSMRDVHSHTSFDAPKSQADVPRSTQGCRARCSVVP